MILVSMANELGLNAGFKAEIEGETKHPDVNISSGFLEELLVDVTNVNSEYTTDGNWPGPEKRMEERWKKKMDTYEQLCRNEGRKFLPCVMSLLGGVSLQTVQQLLLPLARKLMVREGTSINQAVDRIILTLQTAVLRQTARNGMAFLTRHCFIMPEVVQLDRSYLNYGLDT